MLTQKVMLKIVYCLAIPWAKFFSGLDKILNPALGNSLEAMCETCDPPWPSKTAKRACRTNLPNDLQKVSTSCSHGWTPRPIQPALPEVLARMQQCRLHPGSFHWQVRSARHHDTISTLRCLRRGDSSLHCSSPPLHLAHSPFQFLTFSSWSSSKSKNLVIWIQGCQGWH